MSVHRTPDGVWYILDAMKASFLGMDACFSFLDGAIAPRCTVIIGTLADYKGDSRRRYQQVARLALSKADRVIFVGPNAHHLRRYKEGEFGSRIEMFETPAEAAQFLVQDTVPDEVVYLKSAEVEHLERVLIRQLDRSACRSGINCQEFLRRKYRRFLLQHDAAT